MDIAVAGGTGVVGSRIVRIAQARGHATRALSRSAGVDVRTGVGLEGALRGADAVIDVLNIETLSEKAATRFFRTATSNLLDAEGRAGVEHHIALSIVGVDRVPHGYYGAKLAQEGLVASHAVPWTILRATQFHDFAAQMHARLAFGPVHPVAHMRTQPVAVDEVAARLVDLAEGSPQGRARDLSGPQEEDLADMMRAWARRSGGRGWMPRIRVPGAFGAAMRDGSLLPGPDAERGRVTFEEWLAAQPVG
ncbi:SDR family oxidoreductase [Microbacterium sp.]|uniref:SDR family oxidoreductase n=1 Tax=Microbacterium sp. TaxID=51671 RepID=UPI002811AF8D|nr:NAD(P)H-binding protein [Microbacterium sp.]